MFKLFTMIFKNLAIIVLLTLCFASTGFSKNTVSPPVRIDLAVSFDIEAKMIRGTSRIEIPGNRELQLLFPGLNVTAALLSSPNRENAPIVFDHQNILKFKLSDYPRTLLISYEKHIEDSFQNIISDKAIVLTSDWHPVPQSKAIFSLDARVPEGFTSLSQSDRLEQSGANSRAHFSFTQPLCSMTFTAAPYVKKQKKVREGLHIYTLFFQEDQDLAEGYLEAAANYVKRYEKLIGVFPYNHYVIAENIMPTGYGYPTFTLLGQQVIRLPFIKQTSLGHEILHSWFGNNIDIAEESGNWCEGLTTYLADMAYRSETGEGAQVRKEAIQRYQNYINESAPTLNQFYGAGHERRANQPERVVGYQKSAMFFHELLKRVGEELFYLSLQNFYRDFKGRSASWQDLRLIFEKKSTKDLSTFFSQRLNRNDLPILKIDDIDVKYGSSDTTISISISQKQDSAYELLLPVTIKTLSTTTHFQNLISEATSQLMYQVDSTPLQIIIDPEYDLLRSLSDEEDKPLWSSLLGSESVLVVIGDENEQDSYQSFIARTDSYGWQTIKATEIKQKEIEENSIIFLGSSHLSKSILGDPGHPETGFTVDIRSNPFNSQQAIGLISSSSNEDTEAVVNRLSHYGKYAYLHFQKGRIVEKRIADTSMGIRLNLEDLPSGVPLPKLSPFDELVDKLSNQKIVYVGETHTSRADHLLQMMLIEALYNRNNNLVIGMEMFPRSSQPALDAYINDPNFSEAEFLKESKYYQVWQYDYRLFRPIFAFARKNKIPVIGLNIDREIVSSVFKSGSMEDLDAELQKLLPAEMRLDMEGYVERLTITHQMHSRGNHGQGNLPGFIQAQALWDETMAESISNYLLEHPHTDMVVLAGNQHTRKDSGILPRVASRIDAAQATVLNLATNGGSASQLAKTTDYLFFLETHEFAAQGKIGIVLQEKESAQGTRMQIVDINPQANAGPAGIRKNDILIFIDELAIHTMDDVRLALLDRAVGETVRVSVLRGGDNTGEQIDMEVVLYNPALSAGHP